MSREQHVNDCESHSTENQDNPLKNDLSLEEASAEEKLPAPIQEIEQTATDNQNKEEVNLYGMREQGDIRLVLLGRTGSGKSATGNTILAKKEFLSKASGSSITEQSQLAANLNAGHRFVVIDTPGLFDTELTHGDITKEIIRCIHLSTPGPHAFLLVLRIDRFTEEEIDTFSRLFDLFGENMSSYAIIVFTRLDDLEEEKISIDEFIKSSNKQLKHFISKVKGRYIALNNRGTDKQKRQTVANFIKILDEMVQQNGGKHYTNMMYEEAEKELQRKITEVERIKTLEKQKEVDKIESKFKGKMLEIEASNQQLEKKIKTQMEENANIQLEKEKTQERIQNIQLEMSQMEQDHHKQLKESKKIEEIKLKTLQEKEKENKRQIDEMKTNQAENEKRVHRLEKDKNNFVTKICSFVLQQSVEIAFKAFIAPHVGSFLIESFPQIQSHFETTRELSKSLRNSAMKICQNAESNTKYSEHIVELVQKGIDN